MSAGLFGGFVAGSKGEKMTSDNRDTSYIENLSKELAAAASAAVQGSVDFLMAATRGIGRISRYSRDEAAWWAETFKSAAETTKRAVSKMNMEHPFKCRSRSQKGQKCKAASEPVEDRADSEEGAAPFGEPETPTAAAQEEPSEGSGGKTERATKKHKGAKKSESVS